MFQSSLLKITISLTTMMLCGKAILLHNSNFQINFKTMQHTQQGTENAKA